ncbi:unnamed protein product, partial [marine sediment metagenome]
LKTPNTLERKMYKGVIKDLFKLIVILIID